jgi:hypothetical protein
MRDPPEAKAGLRGRSSCGYDGGGGSAQDLPQHDQGNDVVLTEGLNGPEKQRRMAGDGVRAAGTGVARGGSCCRGSSDS